MKRTSEAALNSTIESVLLGAVNGIPVVPLELKNLLEETAA